MNQVRKGLAVAGLTVAAGTAFAAAAFAHEVNVVGGATVLEASKGLVKKADKDGVEIKGGSFKVTGGLYSFHELNDGGGGEISHKSKLVFKKDGKSVKFASPTIDVPADEHAERRHGDDAMVMASVGKKTIELAELDLKSYKLNDEEPGFSVVAKLAKPAAKELKKELGAKNLAEGLKLGTLVNVSEVEEIPEHS